MEEEAHSKYVQLHLQSVNYHSRVNQLVKEASNTIHTRMGFVPGGVKESLNNVIDLQVSHCGLWPLLRHSYVTPSLCID
jgi:hypothetical protein